MTLTLRQAVALSGSSIGRRRLGEVVRPVLSPLLVPWARLHRRTRARGVRVIAVTGSFGKSSTVRLTMAALGLPLNDMVRRNSNGLWAVPRRVLALSDRDHRAVIEIGIDRPGQMARQAAVVAPNVAVVTAVGGEHLETLGSLETIQHEKARLVAALSAGGVAVLNGDDPRVRAMATLAPGEAWTFGLGEGNDVRAADVAVDWPFGMRFTAIVRGESHPVSIPMLGRHMVPPALAALAVAAVEGLPIAQAAAALSRAVPVSYRLEVVPLVMGATLVCDHHKNSAESIRAALELVADVPGRKILVISRVRAGTVDTEPVLREVASMAARLIDQMIVIGDGVEGLVAAACAAGLSPDRVHRAEPGVLDAMRLLREIMRPGDIVLLKARLASKLDRLILGLQGRHVACDLAYCSLFALGCAECAHLGHARRGRLG